MPRTARERSALGIYHVIMRGVNRQQIFDDDNDCRAFLDLVRRIHDNDLFMSRSEVAPWDVYAYALMGNHFHLLIKVRDFEIGDIVKKIASGYVFRFNHRHGRDGHLFRERFKSEVCNNETYLATLIYYIHNNPVKAGLCGSAEEYPYTSWNEYLGNVPVEERICNVDEVLAIFPIEKLQKGMVDTLKEEVKCIEYKPARPRGLSDAEVRDYLYKYKGIEHPTHLQRIADKIERNEIIRELKRRGAGARQLQRLTGIGLATISRIKP